MNRNTWSDDDRAEYDLMCDQAWHSSKTTAGRTDAYLEGLRDGEQAQRYWAKDCLHSALRAGAGAQHKSWRRRQSHGEIAVAQDGKVLSKRRVIGSTLIDDDGNAVSTQMLFDLMTREQLEAKAAEYARNIRAFKGDLRVIMRLLDLMDRAPEAVTPAGAAEMLGTSIEVYLATEEDVA